MHISQKCMHIWHFSEVQIFCHILYISQKYTHIWHFLKIQIFCKIFTLHKIYAHLTFSMNSDFLRHFMYFTRYIVLSIYTHLNTNPFVTCILNPGILVSFFFSPKLTRQYIVPFKNIASSPLYSGGQWDIHKKGLCIRTAHNLKILIYLKLF